MFKILARTENRPLGIIEFIEQTAKNEKVLNGKIKYDFIIEKGKNYLRYVQ